MGVDSKCIYIRILEDYKCLPSNGIDAKLRRILSMQLVIGLVHLLLAAQAAPIEQFLNPEELGIKYQGDMVLPPLARDRGVGIRPMSERWANGVVPYEFAANVSRNNSLFIVQMMREMENLTRVNNTRCISFRPKNTSDRFFLTIFNGSGCFSPVGSWGNYVGLRGVSLMDSPTSTCMISGIIQHELTHTLGFYHEQSRPDRDTYVSIQWANIRAGLENNFEKYNLTEVDTLMTPYDYGSVMHYARNAFATVSSSPTIVPLLNSTAFLGQRVRLSPIDILEIQRYYGCVPTPPDPSVTTTTSQTTISAASSFRNALLSPSMMPSIWILFMLPFSSCALSSSFIL